jgi:hypothetical protein
VSKHSTDKLLNFGALLKKQGLVWLTLVMSDEWDDFCDRQEITPEELKLIRIGYEGKPYRQQPISTAEVILPFGVHKGTPMSQLDMEYLEYISSASWLAKWPVVKEWIDRNKDKIEQHKQGFSEGLAELHSLKQSLA